MEKLHATIDDVGRCKHYHQQNDTTLIKFKCCDKYYPCYKCHSENESHGAQVWQENEFYGKAILCGVCRNELTIHEYLQNDTCLYCSTEFNPNCAKHYDKYFAITVAPTSCANAK